MEIVASSLATGLAGRGWEPGVTCTEALGELGPALRNAAIPVALVPAPGVRSMIRAPRLAAHFRARNPNLVMTHSGVWLRGARAARAAGVGAVLHAIHGLFVKEPWFGPAEKRLGARYTDRIVAVSPSLREYLRQVVRIPDARIEVIPNGIDTARFRPGQGREAARARIGAGPETLVLGCVSRLDPVKNLPLLLRVAAELMREPRNIRVLLVGDGPARAQLEELSATLGIADRVHFAGAVADPEQWYGAMDVFVLPSFIEAAPMCLLEAMASGCCVVATDVGANRATLADGEAGALIPADDHVALSDTLRWLADDRPERHRLQDAGLRRVRQEFSLDRMVESYDDLFRRVLRQT